VGIARFEPEGEWTIEKLLEEADRRLYKHKRERQKPGQTEESIPFPMRSEDDEGAVT
jgi:hypothetical protein